LGWIHKVFEAHNGTLEGSEADMNQVLRVREEAIDEDY